MSSLPYYTRAAGILSWANKKVAVSILGGGTRETDTGVFSDVKFRKLREEWSVEVRIEALVLILCYLIIVFPRQEDSVYSHSSVKCRWGTSFTKHL